MIVLSLHLLFSFQGTGEQERAGVNGNEEPPVPIPNTEVKLIRVDNTWMEASWEDKSMPALARELHFSGFSCIFGPLAQLVRAPGS